MSRFPAGLEPVDDVSPAAWVETALAGWPAGRFLVRDLVPPVFEAYARVLHRTYRPTDGRQPTGTWAERAATLEREPGPETSWWNLLGCAPYEGDRDPWTPEEGCLSESEVARLAPFLASRTSDPSACWFALWSGWGILGRGSASLVRARGPFFERRARWRARTRARRESRELETFSTFDLLGQSGRSYLLLSGSVADAERFRFGEGAWWQSPALWWPEDRSWFVHTEIDAMSTFLGGSQALVDRLVGEQVLESFEVHEDTRAAL